VDEEGQPTPKLLATGEGLKILPEDERGGGDKKIGGLAETNCKENCTWHHRMGEVTS
jgi:hypothetical protein